MIFNPAIETMERSEMEALQLKRLQETVAYVYERVPMYRDRLDEMGVKPSDIKTLADRKDRKLLFSRRSFVLRSIDVTSMRRCTS